MLEVEVCGPPAASSRIASTMRRVTEALESAGARTASGGVVLAVAPARWFASQTVAPRPSDLAATVGYSVAAYGSPGLQEDADIGRHLAVVCHPDLRACEHLERLGCRVRHIALGCRDAAPPDRERRLQLVTLGAATPRRLRVLAHGAPWFDELHDAHHFEDALAPTLPPDLIGDAVVLLDLAEDDDAAPDGELLLSAAEAGTAMATERLGEWPGDLGRLLLRAPLETLFQRASELALDPGRAAAIAAEARQALAAAFPLTKMGEALATVLAEPPVAQPTDDPPELTPVPVPRTVGQILDEERMRPDAAVRHALQLNLHRLRRIEHRLERGDAPDGVETLLERRADAACDVSVLVPCFGARRTLIETLDSVAATSQEAGAPALEIVLVDDGSPQEEGAIAVEWARGNAIPLVVLRHRFNRGLPQSRNTALDHARGELVLPLDADNVLRPRGLRALLDALRADDDATFAYGILQEFEARGPIGLRGLYPWQPDRLRYGNYIDALALIRREALREVGGYTPEPEDQPYQGYEDWDLWCRFAEAGATAVWVPQVVAGYRVRLDSLSAALHLSHVGPLADMITRHPALLA